MKIDILNKELKNTKEDVKEEYSLISAYIHISEKIYKATFMFDVSIPTPEYLDELINQNSRKFEIMLADNNFDLVITKLDEKEISIGITSDKENCEVMNIEELKSIVQSYWRQIDKLRKT